MSEDKVKQVIVIRRNFYAKNGTKFGMRRGKQIAQACHASNGAAFLARAFKNQVSTIIETHTQLILDIPENELEWYFEKFTKATVQVNEEAELLEVADKAKEAGLPCFLVCDEGVTEFDNVPTFTVCAIGPALSSEIDKITGHLELL